MYASMIYIQMQVGIYIIARYLDIYYGILFLYVLFSCIACVIVALISYHTAVYIILFRIEKTS